MAIILLFHPSGHPKYQHKIRYFFLINWKESKWWKLEITQSYSSTRARIPLQWRRSINTRPSGSPCSCPWSWSSLEVADTHNKMWRECSKTNHDSFNDKKPAVIIIEIMAMMMMMMMVVMLVGMGDELFYDPLWHWQASKTCHLWDRVSLFDYFFWIAIRSKPDTRQIGQPKWSCHQTGSHEFQLGGFSIMYGSFRMECSHKLDCTLQNTTK